MSETPITLAPGVATSPLMGPMLPTHQTADGSVAGGVNAVVPWKWIAIGAVAYLLFFRR